MPLMGQRHAFEIVFGDVLGGDQRRREPARHQIVVRIVWMSNTDVPKRIQNSLVRKNAIGRNQVANHFRSHACRFGLRCLSHLSILPR